MVRNRESKDVYATPEHRWFVQKGGNRNNRGVSERTTDELKPGDRLASGYLQAVHTFELSPVGVLHGFAYGDGTVDGQQVRIDLFGSKDEALIPYVAPLQRSLIRPLSDAYTDASVLSYYGFPKSWKSLPSLEEGAPYLRSWLAGYFAADGRVDRNGSAQLSSASRRALEYVRDVATLCGIATYGIKRTVRKGYGAQDSDLYSVTFAKQTLSEKFFVIPAHRERFVASLPPKKSHPDPWVVVAVSETDRREEVFCAVVPDTESFVLEDNILTGNCRVAKGIMRSGRPKQTAIQMAIGRMKVWAAGGGNVKADTRAKAAAAVAEWEKMKMTAQKLAEFDLDTGDVLLLSATLPAFSLEGVKRAFDAQQKGESGQVTEVWTDAVIVQNPDGSTDRFPFEMLDGAVSFGEPQRVTMVAVPVDLADEVLEALADGEFEEEFEQDEDYAEDEKPEESDEEPEEHSEDPNEEKEMEFSATRRVRTPEGAKFYRAPIGSPIVKDPVTGAMRAVVDGTPFASKAKKRKKVAMLDDHNNLNPGFLGDPEDVMSAFATFKSRTGKRSMGSRVKGWFGPSDDADSPEARKWDAQVDDSTYAERTRRLLDDAKEISLDDLAEVAGADMAAEEKKLAAIVHPEKGVNPVVNVRNLEQRAGSVDAGSLTPEGKARVLGNRLRAAVAAARVKYGKRAEAEYEALVRQYVSAKIEYQGADDSAEDYATRVERTWSNIMRRLEALERKYDGTAMQFTRRIRTPEGAKFYGAPIGTPIVRDRVTGKLKAATGAPKLPPSGKPGPEILPGVPKGKATKRVAPDRPFKSQNSQKPGQSAPKLPDDGKAKPEVLDGMTGKKPRTKVQTGPQRLDDVRKRAESYEGEGTPKSPIRVKGDIEAAALLLSEGKSIRLESEMEAGTLLDKLRDVVKQAEDAGKKAPDFDLCKVSVPGTNLFCAQHKGIPRAEMPQFKGADKDGKELDVEEGWRQMLADKGIAIDRKTVSADQLKASQMQLDGPKVAGMSGAMREGKIPDAPIFVTKDGYILDGHHRWAAKVAMDLDDGKTGDINMPVDVIDIEIGEAIDLANAYTKKMGIVPKGLGKDAEGKGVKKDEKPQAKMEEELAKLRTAKTK